MSMIKLYKQLMIESYNFRSYYYKEYFTRKVKSQFRKHINADPATSEKLFKESEAMLDMLRRQTAINNSYKDSKLVIE